MRYDRPGLCRSTKISERVDDRWVAAASCSLAGNVDGIDGLWFSTLQAADGLAGMSDGGRQYMGSDVRATGSLGATSMS